MLSVRTFSYVTFTSHYVSLAKTMPGVKRTATGAAKKIQRFFRKRRTPRGRVSQALTHKFARTCSLYNNDMGVYIRTDSSGNTYFSDGTNLARSLAFDFSLQQVRMYLGGVLRWTVPVPNYAEFSALFDNFKIDYVEVSLSPGWNANNLADSAYVNTTTGQMTGASYWEAYGLPCIGCANDFDDVNSAQISDLQQYESFKYIPMGTAGQPVTFKTFRPRVAAQFYNTAVSTGYGWGIDSGQWIDCASAAVPHYGLKMALDSGTANRGPINTNIAQMNIIFKMHYSFRNAR